MAYTNVKVPEGGARISIKDDKLDVPDNPIIPFVEGDGTGRDIWRASVRVFDAAVEKAYGGKRKVHWMEVYAGEKSFKMFQSWLPDETTEADRRRHPFPERYPAQTPRSVRVPASREVLQGSAFPCQTS
jgi:isocitrate dehydrogenase